MKRIYLVILLLTALLPNVFGQVVQREIKPTIDYSRTPRTYYIANIAIDGIWGTTEEISILMLIFLHVNDMTVIQSTSYS